MRDVVDDPRMSGLTALEWLERCSYKESTREPWEMGGSETNRREVNPLRIEAWMSGGNRNAADGTRSHWNW